MAKRKTLTAAYPVATGPVTLRVMVGEGQLGSSLVTLGKTELASGAIAFLSLGSGALLRGKTLRVTTMVTDVQRMTNRTSVTYVLQGGPSDREYRLEQPVADQGDSVDYTATFRLT